MTKPFSTSEVEELIGAFALDAVDADEREAVERHLADCPRCRNELAGHLEVAALLGNTGAPAPDGVWARISSSLEEPPPAMRLSLSPPVVAQVGPTPAAESASVTSLSSRRRWVNRSLAVAVAAAIAVIALLGVEVVRQDHRIDQMRGEIAASAGSTGLQGAMVAAMGDPSSHKMNLASPTGAPMSAAAVMTEDGTGYFLATSMPALAEGRTYQLWGIMADGQVVSLGVLGNDPQMAAFQATGGLNGLAVTEEVKGGVPQSQNPAVLKA
ncbi:MAG: anti-sigma factor [Acidimicrobiales bacterium]